MHCPAPSRTGAAWRKFAEDVYGGQSPRLDETTLELARAFAPTLDVTLAGMPYTTHEIQIPAPAPAVDIELCVFTPDGHVAPAPGVLWVHGGGMVLGDRDMLEAAVAVGGVIVSVEYRLAPEHPAPAPADDCLAALRWLGEHASGVGIDPARIVVAGGSAGAGLAAAAVLRARDQGGPPLAGLMLFQPMLDDRMTTVSSHQFTDGVPWIRASNEYGWRSLLGDRYSTDDVTIYEAPGRATDLSGLPPTYIDVGSADLFRDEDGTFYWYGENRSAPLPAAASGTGACGATRRPTSTTGMTAA